jgi:methionine-rich copper-binding protein CopC
MRKFIIFLSFFVLIPVIVDAHVYMMETNPEPNAILRESPKMVTITFLGSIEPAFSKIEVFDKSGKKVSKKKTKCREDDTIMEVELEEELAPGEYTVKWLCMSLDGHKQKGFYTFTIE